MHTFDLKRITAVVGKQRFFQLTIDDNPDFSQAKSEEEKNNCKNGVLDDYETQLESVYKKDMEMIYNYMNRVANNEPVSGKKYHELTGRKKSDLIKDYEFKHGDLRVYCFKVESGKIIAFGGYKNNQKKDIVKFRSLKQQYLESLK